MRVSWFLLTLLALGAAASAAQAATIPVTTTADTLANDGLCSLREAVFAARFDLPIDGTVGTTTGCPAGSGDDIVALEAKDYRLAPGGAGEDGNTSGDLDTGPASALRIVGRGMGATVIGASGDRALDVAPGANLGLTDLTVRDSVAPGGASGGAVRNRGVLTVLRVAFINNAAGDGVPAASAGVGPVAPGSGGAIWSEGQLQVADSLFSGDRAGDGTDAVSFPIPGGTTVWVAREGVAGGAVHVAGGSASLSNVTVTGSRAGDGGDRGGTESRAPGGDGGPGGAIAVTGGSATVVNATFQGNRAGIAGSPRFGFTDEAIPGPGGAAAAVAPGSLSITFSTFAGNAPGTGPAGTVGLGASVSGATVGASILADAGGACATPTPSSLANLVLPGDTSCPGVRISGDPRLGALADNGGPVPTMLPGAGSPAIDALVGVPCPATDARGQVRPRFAGCDAGAVEIQPGTPGAPGGAGGPAGTGARRVTALKIGPAAFRAKGRKPLGTTVSFRLSVASKVVLTVRKAAAGKRARRGCVAPTRRLRGAKRCTRQVTLPGKVTKKGTAGLNLIRFSGKLRGRPLAPGPYTLALTLPRLGATKAVTTTKAFRILA